MLFHPQYHENARELLKRSPSYSKMTLIQDMHPTNCTI